MMTLIGLPSTLPPKSSTAICAAVTDPWPVGVEAGPFMSVRTPILTTSSETCASAAGDDEIEAANTASAAIFLAEIKTVLPMAIGRIGRVVWPGAIPGRLVVFATNTQPASTWPIGPAD